MIPTTQRKAILEARQASLLRRIGGIRDELASHQEKDWEELATQREGDEVLESLGVEAQVELRTIKGAASSCISWVGIWLCIQCVPGWGAKS